VEELMSLPSVPHLSATAASLLVALGSPLHAQSPANPSSAALEAFHIRQATLGETSARTPEVSTEQLQQILVDQSALILDTRPHLEWALGHIPGALNVAPKPDVPMSLYTSDVAEVLRLTGGDTSRPLVLYCNGPFCGKSKRVADDLLAAGFTDVRRYQLGAPVWRALGGVMEIEIDGARYVFENDRTAVFVDARSAEQLTDERFPGARNIPLADVAAAKDDGRLPMEDHNTRIVVFGATVAEAREVAEEIARNAFHNVSYFRGNGNELRAGVAR
jgi:rhodanese-related sulfurtransferase